MTEWTQAFSPYDGRERSCITCGLDLPEGRRLYCTAYCAEARHRYARAQSSARLQPGMSPADIEPPEDLDDPTLVWARRLLAMQRRIAEARSLAGLPVPAGW